MLLIPLEGSKEPVSFVGESFLTNCIYSLRIAKRGLERIDGTTSVNSVQKMPLGW